MPMPRTCFLKCEGKSQLFLLPTEEPRRSQWLTFLFNTVPSEVRRTFLCARHFADESFSNLAQFEAGYAQRRLLKDKAAPTLFGPFASGEDSGTQPVKFQPSTSQQDPGTHHRSSTVGCQTQRVETRSVGTQTVKFKVPAGSVATQLSWGTLKSAHVRSKGIQATVFFQNVGTETSTHPDFPLASTPIKGPGLGPRKRRRLELEEEQGETSTEFEEPLDTSYHPDDSVLAEESDVSLQTRSTHSDAKYIVFESCLGPLFEKCPVCKRDCDVQRRKQGTFVAFTQRCPSCSYLRQWESQPIIGSTPVGNLQLSAATYFSGSSFFQLQKICRAMQLEIFQYETFRRHARNYLEPAIIHKWKTDQLKIFQQLHHQGGKVTVAGDMRADSPGHSAKFGSYTLMHLGSNTIVDFQLVQSNEVGGSYHMEKEGLKRCLDHLESNDLAVEHIVTDRHQQVQRFLRERNIEQFYDVWHFEKGLSKKLLKLSQNKDCKVLKRWLRSIKNHVYWSARSTTSGPEKVARWTSVVNHLQNIHVHDDPLFPKCEHPERASSDANKWLKPGSITLAKVERILNNKRVLKDVQKLSHHYQTSSLESFHSLILRFAPKNVVLPFMGMLCRLCLAAMHHNENADREQATTAAGQHVFKVANPKSKRGECTAKPEKNDPTYMYVGELMRLVFEEVFEDPTPFVEEMNTIPIPKDLSTQFDRPSKEEVVARHVSRFSQGEVRSQHTVQPDQETPGVSGGQHTHGMTTLMPRPKKPRQQLTKLR